MLWGANNILIYKLHSCILLDLFEQRHSNSLKNRNSARLCFQLWKVCRMSRLVPLDHKPSILLRVYPSIPPAFVDQNQLVKNKYRKSKVCQSMRNSIFYAKTNDRTSQICILNAQFTRSFATTVFVEKYCKRPSATGDAVRNQKLKKILFSK